MRSLKTGSLLVALVAALALGACGTSDIGDILGGPSGRAPNQLKGIVRAVDTTGGDCRIELDNTTQSYLDNRDSGGTYGDGYGNRATVYCDNATRVVFQGQTYRPESLENGDEVIAQVRDVGGRLVADRIDVTYDVSSNERYDTVRKRAQHADEIVPKLHEALHARTALEWESYLGDDVPCAAARAVEDVFDNPQVLAEGMVATLEHPLVGHYRGLTRAIRFDRTPGPAPFAAPTFGQHSDAVLKQAGCTAQEIEQLRSKGAVLGD